MTARICVIAGLLPALLNLAPLAASGLDDAILDGRSAALSGTCSTLDADPVSFRANPATSGSIRSVSFSAGYADLFGGAGAARLTAAVPVSRGVLNSEIRFLSSSRFNEITGGLRSDRMLSFSSAVLSAGWALRLSDLISFGAGVLYSGGVFPDDGSSVLSLNGGILARIRTGSLPTEVRLAASLLNAAILSSPNAASPAAANLGIGWHRDGLFDLMADMEIPLSPGGVPLLKAGTEVVFFRHLSGRLGFELAGRTFFPSLGAGFSFTSGGADWGLDAAWTPHPDLADRLVLSLRYGRSGPVRGNDASARIGRIRVLVVPGEGQPAETAPLAVRAISNLRSELLATPFMVEAVDGLDLLVEVLVQPSGANGLFTVRCFDIDRRELDRRGYGFSDPAFLVPLSRRLAATVARLAANRLYAGFAIGSNPPGLTVLVDDERAGVTPLELKAVRTGLHVLRFEDRGRTAGLRTVDVPGDGTGRCFFDEGD